VARATGWYREASKFTCGAERGSYLQGIGSQAAEWGHGIDLLLRRLLLL
jgi:hypothetical protein